MFVHILMSNFSHDSRVLRETKSISDAFPDMRLEILALSDGVLPEKCALDDSRFVWRLPIRSRVLPKLLMAQVAKYLEWATRISAYVWNKKVSVVHCHDLSALPIGVFLKILKNTSLIYDAHELETEVTGMRGVRQKFARILESFLIRFADEVIVVSPSIADWYTSAYKLKKIHIVRNIPAKDEKVHQVVGFREKFSIGANSLVCLYQGALVPGRGIESLLKIFSRMPSASIHVVFMGYGGLEAMIQNASRVNPNIHFHSAVSPEVLSNYTRNADIGLCLIENSSLSNYFSLPNKMFEYFMSGVPVVVPNFPDMSQLIETCKGGWVLGDISELEALLRGVCESEIAEKRASLSSNRFSWDLEVAAVIEMYSRLSRT